MLSGPPFRAGLPLIAAPWNDAVHGTELWKTDGTVEGTVMVADLIPGPGNSMPDELSMQGGRVYFAANDAQGRHLWSSDGTPTGTRKISLKGRSTTDANPFMVIPAEGRVFFNALSPRRGYELHVLETEAAR